MGRRGRPAIGGRGRGQSLVEFALIVPVVMLILLLAIDLGRVFLGWVQLNNAARIAANYAASGDPPLTPAQQTQYRQLVSNETVGIDCTVPSPIPDPTYPGSTGTTVGGQAVVNLTCSFRLLTPFVGAIFPGGAVTVGASANFPIRAGILANVSPGQTLPPPVAPNQDFSISPTSGPTPLTVNFTLGTQNGGPAQTWLWDFGDGTNYSGGPTPPAHTYTSISTYTVTLTETNGAGSFQASHTVTVNASQPLPVAGFYGTVGSPCVSVTPIAPNTEQCGDSSGTPIYYTWAMTVNFVDTSLNNAGATYAWNFGDGSAVGTTASPSHTYSNPGVYTVTQTVTTTSGSNSFSRLNYVNAGCVIPVFIGTSTSAAGTAWTNAHFKSNNLSYYQQLANGSFGYKTNVPNPAYTIDQQNPQGGLFTTVGPGNQCTATIRVAPNGANPAP